MSTATPSLRIQNYGEPSVQPVLRGPMPGAVTAAPLGRIRDGDQKYRAAPSLHEGNMTLAGVRAALDEDRLRLYGQKIVPTEAGRPGNGGPSYELLLRLMDRDGKVVPPVDLITTAEHHNLMAEVDRWVLREALLRYGAEIASTPNFFVSINLSAQSLNDLRFLPFFREVMAGSKLPSNRVTFEITETSLIHNLAAAGELLQELRSLGCRIALDDFGVGLCSFHYLKCFKVDYIKIEGSFVQNIVTSPVDLAIVKAINQMAHDLGIETVAEFVKDNAVRERLLEVHVDFSQGYGVGMPTPLDVLLKAAKQETLRKVKESRPAPICA